eukprot:CAMPEP_0115400612 /NCGR_PEP_ID=MMETSP0271-20121206/15445_1 /TAXON_ID=71861 /ORGANISM="Scrippsiella trochoidea, Strain CCMP3099" /LENGTH=192 /DNA_ID=CAMNT_0002824467 /DNA_START=152 /DNA_END=728 /DNA_ORIENTATION=+
MQDATVHDDAISTLHRRMHCSRLITPLVAHEHLAVPVRPRVEPRRPPAWGNVVEREKDGDHLLVEDVVSVRVHGLPWISRERTHRRKLTELPGGLQPLQEALQATQDGGKSRPHVVCELEFHVPAFASVLVAWVSVAVHVAEPLSALELAPFQRLADVALGVEDAADVHDAVPLQPVAVPVRAPLHGRRLRR